MGSWLELLNRIPRGSLPIVLGVHQCQDKWPDGGRLKTGGETELADVVGGEAADQALGKEGAIPGIREANGAAGLDAVAKGPQVGKSELLGAIDPFQLGPGKMEYGQLDGLDHAGRRWPEIHVSQRKRVMVNDERLGGDLL